MFHISVKTPFTLRLRRLSISVNKHSLETDKVFVTESRTLNTYLLIVLQKNWQQHRVNFPGFLDISDRNIIRKVTFFVSSHPVVNDLGHPRY